jgi:hypothetical protein
VLLSPDSTPPVGDLAETFLLSGDTSGALATYEYVYTRSGAGALEIGAKAFNLDISVKAQVNISKTTTLTYNLRGGYDYGLRRLSEGDGLFWTASRQH